MVEECVGFPVLRFVVVTTFKTLQMEFKKSSIAIPCDTEYVEVFKNNVNCKLWLQERKQTCLRLKKSLQISSLEQHRTIAVETSRFSFRYQASIVRKTCFCGFSYEYCSPKPKTYVYDCFNYSTSQSANTLEIVCLMSYF